MTSCTPSPRCRCEESLRHPSAAPALDPPTCPPCRSSQSIRSQYGTAHHASAPLLARPAHSAAAAQEEWSAYLPAFCGPDDGRAAPAGAALEQPRLSAPPAHPGAADAPAPPQWLHCSGPGDACPPHCHLTAAAVIAAPAGFPPGLAPAAVTALDAGCAGRPPADLLAANHPERGGEPAQRPWSPHAAAAACAEGGPAAVGGDAGGLGERGAGEAGGAGDGAGRAWGDSEWGRSGAEDFPAWGGGAVGGDSDWLAMLLDC